MANQEHLDLLKQGSAVWNAWRQQHTEVLLDLRGAHLDESHLDRAHLGGAHLDRAHLRGASLRGASLYEAHLDRANLTKADLGSANLSEANLGSADLSGAHLDRADLSEAHLDGAKLGDAKMWSTVLVNVDLSTVKGLEIVQHGGPSSIGIDTIYRSEGKIPEQFLRDAGVPDTFLTYMHSLVGKPIQYFTCFISHSRKDQVFCDRLYADLKAKGIRAWYLPEDATWGKSIWGEIDRSIKVYDKLVVVCSQDALHSPVVEREIDRALQHEDDERKNILFPLRLDDFLLKEWRHERRADVVKKIAGDFRGWETSAEQYNKAFQRFLKALQLDETTTP